jgi:hypothetical protein
MKTKQKQIHTLVDVEITGSQMMLKLVSFRPKTQAEMTLHVCKCCGQHGRRDHTESQTEGNGMNQAGIGSVFQSTRCCQISFSLFKIINSGPPPREWPCRRLLINFNRTSRLLHTFTVYTGIQLKGQHTWNSLNRERPLSATISSRLSKCLPSVVSL